MENLNPCGWISYQNHVSLEASYDQSQLARVISIRGFKYSIVTVRGIFVSELLGRLLVTHEKEEQPKVGDWVLCIQVDDESIFISEVLPRFNQLYRKYPGQKAQKQVLATNLDQVVVVQGLDQEFNLNRLERYLVQITICRIKPIVILNKCDLIEDQVFYRESIRRLQRNIQPYFCSTTTGEGVEVLAEEVFTKGTTSALIGSSGVGKSSLTNALQNHKSRSVGSVSHATGKGRHITTTRDLILLDNGSIIIDTPGMREFGVGYEEDGDFATQFPAIDRLAKDCRYLDCAHIREKGCAVIEAYQTGDLDPLIYDNYLKLYKEQERFQLSKHEQNRQGKRFGKMVKEVKHFKRKYKS